MVDMIPKRQWQVSERRFLLVAGDLLAILLAVLLSLAIWVIVDGRVGVTFALKRLYWFPILAGLWLLLAHANDFYSLRLAARTDASLLRLAQITLQLVVIYVVVFFLAPRNVLPRLFILYYGVSSFLFIAAWRAMRPTLFDWVGARRRALIVGAGWTASAIIETLRHDAPGDYEVVGVILDTDSAPPEDDFPAPVLGAASDLLAIARRERVSEIILAQAGELSGQMRQAILDCYEQGIAIVPMPLLYEQVTGRVPVEHVGQRAWPALLPLERDTLFDPYPPIKRALDIALSLAGLAIFAALLPGIALALWLDSPGPIFFRQARVGKGGYPFEMIKLRTMIPDAEREGGPQWASFHDPRVTRVGRFLRRTRLDEAPQWVNVLRGEMSMIGPRPERPEFVEALSRTIPFYRARHVVRPGITGWAQVRYDYGSSEADALIKLQYDLYYIRHRSLALDVLIMLRTVGKIVTLRGT
jgi:exopolysaccharide biosynthesis polyprenyl glycosylphosphotransferase